MRIAIVSDIHGNLPALEAVERDIADKGVDEIWCGGDIAWAGPWASECISWVRESGWKTVRGNADVWITGDPQTITEPEERARHEEIAGIHAITHDDAQWLLGLPVGHSGPGSLLLVHGTPLSPFRGPQPDAPAGEFEPYEGQAGVVVFGHVHKAFVRRLHDGTIVANAGSVGLPLDGDDACYLIVESTGAELTLIHQRVAFDRAAAVGAAKKLGGAAGDLFLQLMGEA